VVTDARAEEKKAIAKKKHDATQQKADELLGNAQAAEHAARQADFKDKTLNEEAAAAIAQWRDAKHTASAASKGLKGAKPVN
jgi:hypothetical protein